MDSETKAFVWGFAIATLVFVGTSFAWGAFSLLAHLAESAVILTKVFFVWLIELVFVVLGCILALVVPLIAGIVAFSLIASSLAQMNSRLKRLSDGLSTSTRTAAVDTGIVTALGALCGFVAYVASGGFATHATVLELMAACALALCVAKLFMVVPARAAKGIGVFCTAVVLVGMTLFLVNRYHVFQDPLAAAKTIAARLAALAPGEFIILTATALLMGLSVLYPWPWSSWRRLFRASVERAP